MAQALRTAGKPQPGSKVERSRKPDGLSPQQREAHWRRLGRQWKKSGLTQVEFCSQNNVPLTVFRWWRSELKRRDQRMAPPPASRDNEHPTPSSKAASSGLSPNAFVPVPMPEDFLEINLRDIHGNDCCALEVLLPSGKCIRINKDFDVALLQKLVRALEGCPC